MFIQRKIAGRMRLVWMMSVLMLTVVMLAVHPDAAAKTKSTAAKKKKVALNKKTLTLGSGKTYKLKLKNIPAKKKVKWSSSKKRVATVSKKGKVTAKKAGTANIYAKVGKKKYACKVTTYDRKKNKKEQLALINIVDNYKYLSSDLSDKFFYTWENGHLTAINFSSHEWYEMLLSKEDYSSRWNSIVGTIDFSPFTYLRHLDVSGNCLTGINVKKNLLLETLKCSDNNLKGLDVSNNRALKVLECQFNCNDGASIPLLDVSNSTGLTELNCYHCETSELRLGKAQKLEKLSCAENHIKKLDVSDCRALTELICHDNEDLAALNVSHCPRLTELKCYSTSISQLDLRANTELTILDCYNTRVSELDVSRNTKLQDLSCGSTQISELEVSKNTKLEKLYCGNTSICELNLENNPELVELSIVGTKIKALDMSRHEKCTIVYCDDGVDLTVLHARVTRYS